MATAPEAFVFKLRDTEVLRQGFATDSEPFSPKPVPEVVKPEPALPPLVLAERPKSPPPPPVAKPRPLPTPVIPRIAKAEIRSLPWWCDRIALVRCR